MKKLNFTFLFTMLSMVGLNASAANIAVENADGKTIYYNFINNNTELAVTYRGSYTDLSSKYTGNVVVPESVTYNEKTYRVTSIGDNAFYICLGLTSIDIPNSVTSIGGGAFSGCSGLTSITIPNSVTSIGGYAFEDCSGLTSITIPNSVTSIGESAFRDCSGLTSITIPNSVTSIGSNAFYNTAWYNNLPDGLVYAGKVAYKYKGTMPENTSITIKDGTLGIAGGAFRDCSSLYSVTIPNSVTNIGSSAFYDCSGLTSIEIPNSVTSIGGAAFIGCSGLTSVTFHCNNVGTWFIGMSSIKEVWIEKEVTSIAEESFAGCSGLQSVYNNAEDVFTIAKETFDDATYSSATLYVPTGMKATYQNTSWWLSFNKIEEYDFPTGITIPQQSKDVKVVDAYQINGLKTGSMQKGLNILKMSDGTIRKVVK